MKSCVWKCGIQIKIGEPSLPLEFRTLYPNNIITVLKIIKKYQLFILAAIFII